MADKTESPTEQKLIDLRREGRIHFSPLAVRLTGIATGALLLISWFGTFLSQIKEQYNNIDSSDLGAMGSLAIQSLSSFLIALLVIAAACCIVGVLQTKFYFRLDEVTPRIRRLWYGNGAVTDKFIDKVFNFILTPVLGVIGVLVIVRIFWPEFMKLLTIGPAKIEPSIAILGKSFLGVIAAVATVGIIVSWLVVRYRFMLQHRMTRAEIENEARQK